MTDERSRSERENVRRYTLELGGSSVIYVITVLGANFIARRLEDGDPWRIAVALVPAVAAIAMVLAVVRWVMRSDEMQQRVYGIAAVIALVMTIALSFTWGFLETYAGLPAIEVLWLGIFGVMAWGFGAMWVQRRYR
jgi:hypothetical protein